MPNHVRPKTSILANTAGVSAIIQTQVKWLPWLHTVWKEESVTAVLQGWFKELATNREALIPLYVGTCTLMRQYLVCTALQYESKHVSVRKS